MATGQRRRVGKAPVQSLGYTRKDRTFFRAGFIANRDDVGKKLSALENVKDTLCFLFLNIDSDFIHYFHRQRVERARLESGALRFKIIGANEI